MSFRIRFWPTFFTALGLILLICLGTWQLLRYQSAASFEGERDARIDEPIQVIDHPEELQNRDLDYRQISVNGRLDSDQLFLIKHRVYQGSPGFWAVSPLILDGEEQTYMLPVNRGWLPFEDGRDRAEELLAETDDSTVEFTGLLHRLDDVVGDDDFRDRLHSDAPPQGVVELESYDITGINDAHRATSFDRPIVLTRSPDETSDELPLASYDHITTPYLTSDTHFGYMLTWYLLALALIAIWIAHGLGLLVSRAYDHN